MGCFDASDASLTMSLRPMTDTSAVVLKHDPPIVANAGQGMPHHLWNKMRTNTRGFMPKARAASS